MATIMNPHTGMPVDFSSIDPNDPLGYQKMLQLAGLGGAIQAGPQGGERMRGAGGQELAALMAQQGLYDPSALDGYTAGQGRQDYNLTTYLRDPSGNLAGQETNYDRESMNSGDWQDAILKSIATAGAVYGAGTGLSALGVGGAGTATLGAGTLGTPIATSAALPSLGAMSMPTAASLGIGELAAIGGGLGAAGGGIGTLGTIAPSAATTASSALPALGQMPAVSAGTIGGSLPSLSQLSGGGSMLESLTKLGGAGQYIAPALGALAGGIDAAQGQQDTQTQQSKLDPNMQRLLYGDNGQGGLLNQANAFFQQNRGINPKAQQGLDMQKAFYTDPAYAQGYGQLRSQGLGLLGQPIAGNPFARKGG